MARPRSPRVARWLATAVLPDPVREAVLGDLEEQFARQSERRPFVAWRRHGARCSASRCTLRRCGTRPTAPISHTSASSWRTDVGAFFATFVWSPRRYSLPGLRGHHRLTLALAIGANTLLFSIANPLLVRALPLRDQSTLG